MTTFREELDASGEALAKVLSTIEATPEQIAAESSVVMEAAQTTGQLEIRSDTEQAAEPAAEPATTPEEPAQTEAEKPATEKPAAPAVAPATEAPAQPVATAAVVAPAATAPAVVAPLAPAPAPEPVEDYATMVSRVSNPQNPAELDPAERQHHATIQLLVAERKQLNAAATGLQEVRNRIAENERALERAQATVEAYEKDLQEDPEDSQLAARLALRRREAMRIEQTLTRDRLNVMERGNSIANNEQAYQQRVSALDTDMRGLYDSRVESVKSDRHTSALNAAWHANLTATLSNLSEVERPIVAALYRDALDQQIRAHGAPPSVEALNHWFQQQKSPLTSVQALRAPAPAAPATATAPAVARTAALEPTGPTNSPAPATAPPAKREMSWAEMNNSLGAALERALRTA